MLKFIRQAKVAANRLLCAAFGHKYKLKRRITANISELVCLRCKKEFGINCATKSLLEMDCELKEMHEDLMSAVNIRNSFG